MEELLGRVTHNLPGGGEERQGQVTMARRVAAAIDASPVEKHRHVLIEAGTGTGKSLAYLVPIIASEKRAVIATATIALQGQLVIKDTPLVGTGLDRDVTAAVLKGRGNYLCRQRLVELERANHAEQLDLLAGANPGLHLEQIRSWADETVVGDREELDPAPPNDLWRAVSVGADECPGATRCPSGDSCFAEAARTKAMDADVIVTNHHYYGLNIASEGVLLPEHDIVVFDEAHHLPDVISSTCGNELSGGRFRTLSRRIRGVLTDDELPGLLDRSAIDLDNQLRSLVGETVRFDDDLVSLLVSARDRTDRAVAALRKVNPPDGSDTAAKVERAQMNATSVVNDIDAVMSSDEHDICWVDGSADYPVLRRTPLDVGSILEAGLWEGERAVVLTSATLPDGLATQLGLPDSTTIERVGSPFDYEALGLLYCATHLPDPRQPDFRQAVRDEMVDLIEAAGGRTLGLFTSASAMREAAEDLRERLGFAILVQNEKSKPQLIEEFMAEPSSVLLATMSFWQGVDLPGDALTLVTIDRLPFPRPNEPVMKARRDRAGATAFRAIDLPRAQMLLAQAAGRLIRRSDDRGVVAVLDTRLAKNRAYRWDLINALPPLRRTRHREEVIEFLRSLDRVPAPESDVAVDDLTDGTADD